MRCIHGVWSVVAGLDLSSVFRCGFTWQYRVAVIRLKLRAAVLVVVVVCYTY